MQQYHTIDCLPYYHVWSLETTDLLHIYIY